MTTVDVAVVGGGIIGCMVAREIVHRAPSAAVAVIERGMIGSGASDRSAGLHISRGASERVRRMTAYSEQFYLELSRSDPQLPLYPLEMFVLAGQGNAETVPDRYTRGSLSPATGLPVSDVVVPEGTRLWRARGAQRADVSALARAVLRDQSQIQVQEGIRVSALDPDDGQVEIRFSTGGTLTASRVVLAPGPWIDCPAWRDLVAPLGVRVKKVVALHISRPPARHDPVIVFEDEDAFLLPLPERRIWLFSYTCQEWDVLPDGITPGLSARDYAAALAVLRDRAPALERHGAGGRVFCDAYSADREPVIRALHDNGRVIFAGAANGSGYRLAPAIAAEAVDLLEDFG